MWPYETWESEWITTVYDRRSYIDNQYICIHIVNARNLFFSFACSQQQQSFASLFFVHVSILYVRTMTIFRRLYNNHINNAILSGHHTSTACRAMTMWERMQPKSSAIGHNHNLYDHAIIKVFTRFQWPSMYRKCANKFNIANVNGRDGREIVFFSIRCQLN